MPPGLRQHGLPVSLSVLRSPPTYLPTYPNLPHPSPPPACSVIRETVGAFNWALFSPTEKPDSLEMVNAGSLSVPELVRGRRVRAYTLRPLTTR